MSAVDFKVVQGKLKADNKFLSELLKILPNKKSSDDCTDKEIPHLRTPKKCKRKSSLKKEGTERSKCTGKFHAQVSELKGKKVDNDDKLMKKKLKNKMKRKKRNKDLGMKRTLIKLPKSEKEEILGVANDASLGYLHTAMAQELDSVIKMHLVAIENKVNYFDTQLRQHDCSLDNQWGTFPEACNKRKRKQRNCGLDSSQLKKGEIHLPSLNFVYQTIFSHRKILEQHMARLNELEMKVREMVNWKLNCNSVASLAGFKSGNRGTPTKNQIADEGSSRWTSQSTEDLFGKPADGFPNISLLEKPIKLESAASYFFGSSPTATSASTSVPTFGSTLVFDQPMSSTSPVFGASGFGGTPIFGQGMSGGSGFSPGGSVFGQGTGSTSVLRSSTPSSGT